MADIHIKIEPYERRRDRKIEWHLAVSLLRHFSPGMSEHAACKIVFDMVEAEHSLESVIAVRQAVRRIGPTKPLRFVSRRGPQPSV